MESLHQLALQSDWKSIRQRLSETDSSNISQLKLQRKISKVSGATVLHAAAATTTCQSIFNTTDHGGSYDLHDNDALQSLILILERDGFSHQYTDYYGGTALHTLLASATASVLQMKLFQLQYGPQIQSAETNNILSQLCSLAKTVAKAVEHLIQAGCNPNVTLTCNSFDEEEELENQRTYSDQSISMEWNALTFALHFLALLIETMELILSNMNKDDDDDSKIYNCIYNDSIKFAFEIIEFIAANGKTEINPDRSHTRVLSWTPLDYAISLSFIYGKEVWFRLCRTFEPGVEPLKFEQDILTDEQLMLLAISFDDPNVLKEYFMKNLEELLGCNSTSGLRLKDTCKVQQLVPFSEMFWGEKTPLSLLSYSAGIGSVRCLRILIALAMSNKEYIETLIEESIVIVFTKSKHNHCGVENWESLPKRQRIISVCQILLSGSDEQRLLYRMLLHSCREEWGLPLAFYVLLKLGADASGKHYSQVVVNNITPLHVVAGRRGRDGEKMAKELLLHGADINVVDASGKTAFEWAIEYGNTRVVETLWTLQNTVMFELGSKLKGDTLFYLGKSAVEGQLSVPSMFEYCIKAICEREEKERAQELLGRLLLWVLDPRSAIGKCKKHEDIPTLGKAMTMILSSPELGEKKIVPSFLADESGFNSLHFVLDPDRLNSEEIRKLFVLPLCELASRQKNCDDSRESNPQTISSKCASTFGAYTPLHLACALGCIESMRTLLNFGADANAVDGTRGIKPFQYLSSSIILPESIKEELGYDSDATFYGDLFLGADDDDDSNSVFTDSSNGSSG